MSSLTGIKDICHGFFLLNNNDFASYYIKSHISGSTVVPSKQAPNAGVDAIDKASKPRARLLIVDDEPDVLQLFKLALQQSSSRFLVDAFTNPKEALQKFKSNAESYSLMITDVRMPELSGIQLTKEVKEINPNVKVVLITAYEMRENELSKMFTSSAQIDGFIQKPIGIEDLNNKVLNIMEKPNKEEDRG